MKMKKTMVYPSKTTLNLCMKEKNPLDPRKVIPLVLLVLALAGLFSKFMVADRLSSVNVAMQEYEALARRRDELEPQVHGFAQLREEHARYAVGWMSAEERETVPRTAMLSLVQSVIAPRCLVSSFQSDGNVLSLRLNAITLDMTSQLVQELYTHPMVTSVQVFSADSPEDGAEQAAVSMVITMKNPEGGQKR